jgi:hypothetical protein
MTARCHASVAQDSIGAMNSVGDEDLPLTAEQQRATLAG